MQPEKKNHNCFQNAKLLKKTQQMTTDSFQNTLSISQFRLKNPIKTHHKSI